MELKDSMPKLGFMFEIEALVDRARTFWRETARRETSARIELFAKVSLRSKVSRALQGQSPVLDQTHETGLAVRVMRVGHEHAGFASASGLSAEVVRWAVDKAGSFDARVPASSPGPSDSIHEARWDLDAESPRPAEDELASLLITHPNLEWIEAGTTLEVLIGAEGWFAARRRNRVWALDAGARLLAQRGFGGWERLLDDAFCEDSIDPNSNPGSLGVLVLAPDAASSVVAALVEHFHGPGAVHSRGSGRGWSVTDEPNRPDGVAGGSFDDAGFPAVTRVLAIDGVWMGEIGGPGTLRRASFREPPTESATNLVVPPGETLSIPAGAAVARRCRVLRMSSELWVLELELNGRSGAGGCVHGWVRVRPQALLDACASRLGGWKVTPSGPIAPWLLFEGLAAANRE